MAASDENDDGPQRKRMRGDEVESLISRWLNAEHRLEEEEEQEIVAETYRTLKSLPGCASRIEYAQYLEVVAWPRFCRRVESKAELTISIAVVINEKAKMASGKDALSSVLPRGEESAKKNKSKGTATDFSRLFDAIVEHVPSDDFEREARIAFLIVCFQSLEHAPVRKSALRLTSLALWQQLSPERRAEEFTAFPQLERHWMQMRKKQNAGALSSIARDLLASVEEEDSGVGLAHSHFAKRCVELMTDLMSQLPTRRFLRAVLSELRFFERLRLSGLYGEDRSFQRLVDYFGYYYLFDIDDQSGIAPSLREAKTNRQSDFHVLQQACFETFAGEGGSAPEQRWAERLAFGSVEAVSRREELESLLGSASEDEIRQLASSVGIREDDSTVARAVLLEKYASRQDQLAIVNRTPLLPTETLLWDENTLPAVRDDDELSPLVLPKLNLQFLNLHDYLHRNLTLYRLESAYQIRCDLVDAIKRMDARLLRSDNRTTTFGGWARRARPVAASPSITRVDKPKLGSLTPAIVECSFEIDLAGLDEKASAEWDALRDHRGDVVFLVCVDASEIKELEAEKRARDLADEDDCDFPMRHGVTLVRGGVVQSVDKKDESRRALTVALDPAQYVVDDKEIYASLNLVVRRDPKVNTFRSVLSTLRDIMNEDDNVAMPNWLKDVLLGYGDPAAAHFSTLGELTLNYADTFLDKAHVEESFSGMKFVGESPPFLINFQKKIATSVESETTSSGSSRLRAEKARLFGERRRNAIRFTSTQIEAIRDGVNPGLTRICGPPGTGKTDVAVQIISTLFRNFPNDRTLVVAHSNAALNDIFEKVLDRDVEPRYLVRLGSGASELEADSLGDGYSKVGRVEANLERRLFLLSEVQRLAKCFGSDPDVGYACETAHYFDVAVVAPALAAIEKKKDLSAAAPLVTFFGDDLYEEASTDDQKVSVACAAARCVRQLLDELQSYRAFELLRSHKQRSDYLLTKQARIIALTCTHAALARKDLVDIGFGYDNVVIEEAGQVLEIETFVPLLLQQNSNRLKRLVMIGDDRQLPPVVSHRSLERYSRLDQSLFVRLGRLATPTVHLDMQGRSRHAIADLFRWRYPTGQGKLLGDLPRCAEGAYELANPGFVFDHQFIDLSSSSTESQPTPHFYQNLAEAEYVVATFQYMRLLGYPASTVSILAAYNGQRNLIRDILRARCETDPRFGLPAAVSTIDKFQGQQNDYVLLSLTRTKRVGHLRDIRRLVVALSRAKLGLYIFGHRPLLEACPDLKHFTGLLFKRPTKLTLAFGDPDYSAHFERRLNAPPPTAHAIEDANEMRLLVDQLAERRNDAADEDGDENAFIGPELPS